MSKWILIGPVVGAVLITLALIVGYIVVPPIIIDRVIESTELIEGTDQYERWLEVPQPLDFKVYIFNVTNVDEVQQGLAPRVKEIGPYIYKQYRKKFDVTFSTDKERVSYYQQMTFEFDAEKSAPFTQDDNITIFSMHVNSVIHNVANGIFPAFLQALGPNLGAIFGPTNSLFTDTTVRKFLFDGIEFCSDRTNEAAYTFCDGIEQEESQTIVKDAEGDTLRFSMFAHKNRTHDGRYEINSGIRRISKLLDIQKWNGRSTLNIWKSNEDGTPSECQAINGTDASAAPPFRDVGDAYYVFSSDICRSVHLMYEKKSSYEGIGAFRYASGDDFLNEMPNCFCVNKSSLADDKGCLRSGAIDLLECLAAPVIATLPHFLYTDEEYGKLIIGLGPDPELHANNIDIEPYTGAPLRGGKRIQFNMFLEKYPYVDITNNFVHGRLFPVLWVDEGIALNEEMVNLIKGDLTNTLTLISILQWSIFGVGVALFVAMLAWYFFARSRKAKTVAATSVNPAVDAGNAEAPTPTQLHS